MNQNTEQPRLEDEIARFYSWLVECADNLDAEVVRHGPAESGPAADLLHEVKERFQPVIQAMALDLP